MDALAPNLSNMMHSTSSSFPWLKNLTSYILNNPVEKNNLIKITEQNNKT